MEIWPNEVYGTLNVHNSSSLLLFLQFWARCPNLLQHLHSLSFFLSSSSLSLARTCFSLSKLLINELYCSWNIIVTSQDGYRVNDLILLLLHLLGYKISTQPDTYCPTYYCPSNMVIQSLYKRDSYSRWPFRSNCHSSVCTTHNRVQHKVYTKKQYIMTWQNG